jgi:N-methylhydantoinase B
LGVRRDYTFPGHTPSFSILSDKAKYPPWGLFDGGPARPAKYILNPDTPEARALPSKITLPLKPGDVISVQTPGGGGCEAAWKRPVAQVVTDVALGKISAERARQAYGVVLDPIALTLDEAATAEARTLLAQQSVEKTDA